MGVDGFGFGEGVDGDGITGKVGSAVCTVAFSNDICCAVGVESKRKGDICCSVSASIIVGDGDFGGDDLRDTIEVVDEIGGVNAGNGDVGNGVVGNGDASSEIVFEANL
jgi:hypothetical protein